MFICTPDNDFDPEKYFPNVSIQQSLFYRKWQLNYGRKCVILIAENNDNKVKAYVQCFEYELPIIGSVWVASHGPIGEFDSISAEEAFYDELKKKCLKRAWYTSHIRMQRKDISLGYKTTVAETTEGSFQQPLVESILDIDRSLDDIVNDFSKSLKRDLNICKTNKEYITLRVEEKDFNKYLIIFYELLLNNAKEKNFNIHPFKYYESLFSELEKNHGYGKLILGYIDEGKKPVSLILCISTSKEMYSLFVANSNEGYEYKMSVYTTYKAIKEAVSDGLLKYNLGGVSSGVSSSLNNLSIFKGKFGGDLVTYVIGRDIVTSRFRYYVFRFSRLKVVQYIRRCLYKLYKSLIFEIKS